jgi:tungstate transport system permease protein
MSFVAETFQQAADLVINVDARLWRIVALSLAVSGSATVMGVLLGLPVGALMAVSRFPGRPLVLALLNTLLALPSVVVGLLVYLLLSRSGPLGSFGILFTPTAMVVAQTVLVLPIVAALSRQVIEGRWREHGEQLRSLGAGRFVSALILAADERMVMLTIALTAFGRAVAEVGAVMIVGGNIDGFTRVMTTAIALETSKGDLPLALGLGVVLLGVVALLHGVAALAPQGLQAWRKEARHGGD